MAWNNTDSQWVTLIVDHWTKELKAVYSTYDNQPERSKREDFWPSDHIWCGCPECGECKCKRCGALNIVETQ